MKRLVGTCLLLLPLSACSATGSSPRVVKHVDVYRIPSRFGGWPANHGIWSWGDEILVGLSAGHYKDRGPWHHIDHDKPEEHLLARSLDGGETWAVEDPSAKGFLIPYGKSLHGIAPPHLQPVASTDCPGGVDFAHPNFALTPRMTDLDAGRSRWHYSTDRGKTWAGPFKIPNFDTAGITARTDYIVNGRDDCMMFLTAARTDAKGGRTFCMRTTDGGKTWTFLSYIGPEHEGSSIMPATVRVSETELVTTVRRRENERRFIDAYASPDHGKSWTYLGEAVADTGDGNPPAMIRLTDGRLCLTYGYRAAPFGMRAKLSDDNGRTWGEEIILRNDGGGTDLGYPRTVQRPDGKLVTVYYFCDDAKSDRYIAATIWDPGRAGT